MMNATIIWTHADNATCKYNFELTHRVISWHPFATNRTARRDFKRETRV